MSGDDYPTMRHWMNGGALTGFLGDQMEVEVRSALYEIERLRKRLQACQSNDDSPLTDDCITQNERFLLAEVERLRVERDDHKARLAVEAVTAPDADYDTMVDSLQARIRDMWAEIERLWAEYTFVERLVAGQLSARLAEVEADRTAERALADQLAEALRDACDIRPFISVWQEAQKALTAYEGVRRDR